MERLRSFTELPARLRFIEALTDVHRQVALDYFALYGVILTKWDQQSAVILEQRIKAVDPRASEKMFADVLYDDPTKCVGPIGEVSRRIYPGDILGRKGFSLFESSVPTLPYKDFSYGNVYADKIDQPTKVLDVFLHSNATQTLGLCDPDDRARIFVGPKTLPVAVYDVNLRYVYEGEGIDPEDASIVPLVAEYFGDDAVHFLNDASCQAVIDAIRAADKMYSNEYVH